MSDGVFILGAGVTGVAASLASGLKAFESAQTPGGICTSYYLHEGESTRRHQRAPAEDDFRFETGGGHWIFGGSSASLAVLAAVTRLKVYERISAVYLPQLDLYVPYPLQYHLHKLPEELRRDALEEILNPPPGQPKTMSDMLLKVFGRTLCDLFFFPFHERYTAGFYHHISPQDQYKSPLDREAVQAGFRGEFIDAGYNVRFVYPENGLGSAIQSLASRSRIEYGKQIEHIDVKAKRITFADGSSQPYRALLSTLPLNRMIELTGLDTASTPDPCTSVLVLNLGAIKGPRCPSYHWIYVPQSKSGFHRVGFYSNVEPNFLPSDKRDETVSIYVETAYRYGEKPDSPALSARWTSMIEELQDWGFIGDVLVADPTWIDVAYTWRYPESRWVEESLELLAQYDIQQIGRYGRWHFQGIAESIREGLVAGERFVSTRVSDAAHDRKLRRPL